MQGHAGERDAPGDGDGARAGRPVERSARPRPSHRTHIQPARRSDAGRRGWLRQHTIALRTTSMSRNTRARVSLPGPARRWPGSRWPGSRAAGLTAAVAGIALAASACGGEGSSTGGSAASGSVPDAQQQALACSQCMQSHGDPGFPDPQQGPGGAWLYAETSQTRQYCRTRRARHLPGRGRAAVPAAPHRRRGTGRDRRAAHHARVGDPGRRERLHDRHLPADHRPPPAPGSRIPPQPPRGIRSDARASPSPDPARRLPRQHRPRPSHSSCNPQA